jgi:DNA-binding CsgD family transcriptional regulator
VASTHLFFRRLLEIGAANPTFVQSPVSWARAQVEAALDSECRHNAVTLWLRWSICDEVPLSPAIIDNPEAFTKYLTEWRPPSWLLESFDPQLLREPHIHWDTPIFDSQEQNFSQLVHKLTNRFRTKLGSALDRIEVVERVEYLTWTAPAAARKMTKLSPKEVDHYIDSHRVFYRDSDPGWDKLTDRQRQVASLRYECHLSVARIAALLGRHRKTVDECLSRADKKLNVAAGASRKWRRRARAGPDY